MIALGSLHALVAAALFTGGAGRVHVATAVSPPSVHVGTRTLFRCTPRDSGVAVAGYCDVLRVPLDWNDPNSGTIGIRFEWIPARDPTTATIVAQEGGPGFPSTASGLPYTLLFGPLLMERNLLLMDERGTGASSPIDCKPLQRYASEQQAHGFHRVVEACGAQLNHTFRTQDGRRFVHASDLFATPQSVRDLAAILRALELPPVDLYGDSYGTFFAQAFAVNHPELVRSLVLDGAYPLDQDMFDALAFTQIRFAFDAVCARSDACRAAAPGSSVGRLRRLARRLAAAPLRARGSEYDAGDLLTLLEAAGNDLPPLEYRNLDAAARALLDRGDTAPLVRLFAWSKRAAHASNPSSFTEYSLGMKFSSECTSYRNPFDMRAPYAERARQFAAAVAALPASMFDPIPKSVAVADANQGFDECLHWPAPVHDDPVVNRSPPLLPPELPVLVISGDLDSTTPSGDARIAADRLGPSVRFVSIRNAGHGASYSDRQNCGSRIVRAFVLSPHLPLDTTCTERLPEIRAAGVFPLTLADQPPAARRSGDRTSTAEARLAALAVSAVGDVLQTARFLANDRAWCKVGFCGSGLRGGTFAANWDLTDVVLHDVAYSRDSTVSGSVSLTKHEYYSAPSVVAATVRASYDRGRLRENLTIRFDERQVHALATIDGRASTGHPIHETVPAP